MIRFGISKRLPCGFDTWFRLKPETYDFRINGTTFSSGGGPEILVSSARFYKLAGIWFGYCVANGPLPAGGTPEEPFMIIIDPSEPTPPNRTNDITNLVKFSTR